MNEESLFLEIAEFQALEQQPMTMADWITALDNQIVALRRDVRRGTMMGGLARVRPNGAQNLDF